MEKPAIEGGTPVRDSLLPYGQQWITEEDIQAVVDVLRSDFITQGPKIAEFERAVADWAGAKFAVAFASGTAALHAACSAAGIGAGDEVITSPMTFLASSNSVLYCGGTPVFADILPDTYNIDPEQVKTKLSDGTKAIIAVDYTGQPADMDAIAGIAREHGVITIQDAAHSLGATYNGKRVGTLADMTMFSFHPVKHVTSGEGGVIVTDNEEWYRRMLQFRNHGMTKEPSELTRNDGPWYYEMQSLGYHYRMTDMQAALGLSQMKRLDDLVEIRRTIAAEYIREFNELDGIVTPYQDPRTNSSWHLFMLRWKESCFRADRKTIFEALRAENIGVHVHYIPVHLQPYYRELGYQEGDYPVAESFYKEAITIPIYPKMSEMDRRDVVKAVKKIHAWYKI